MVTDKVRPETGAVNEELIRGVFDELAQVAPENVRYTAFVLEDGVSFMHVARVRATPRNAEAEIAAESAPLAVTTGNWVNPECCRWRNACAMHQ